MSLSCSAQPIHSTNFTPEFSFTKGIEGSAVDEKGNLYTINFKEQGTIGIVYDNGNAVVFTRLPGKSICNDIRFGRDSDLFISDYVGHNVFRIKKGSKESVVSAHNPLMTQPIDLTIKPDGLMSLSDPNGSENSGCIWMVNQVRDIILLEENMGTTNGIAVSPDGKNLHVYESNHRNVWQYDIEINGSLSYKSTFITFKDFGMDGMRCDNKGKLYITRYGKGTVVVVSPDKKIIKKVQLRGKNPSNITFGGKNSRPCFLTMADHGCFESFPALHPGAS